MPRVMCAAAAAVVLLLPVPAHATDFYVSALGSDVNGGTSPTAPWRTFGPLNLRSLQPGDRVLLRGGDTLDGTIALDATDRGSPSAPIMVTSYGSGRATIRAGNGSAIYAYNTAGITVTNVNAVGNGSASSGIVFYADLPGDVKLDTIRIDTVEVRGFGRDGIEIGSWNGATGFRNVRITGVSAHDNARTGILTYAYQPNVHQSLYVGYSRAYNNAGIATATTNTGSGIVLGGVDGGTIERSVAHDNGRLCTSAAGPVGIWTYDSRRVVIQQNESYNNRTGGPADGGGFDLDQNVSDSVIQYNYSHGNDGAGFLLAHGPSGDGHHDNVVRFNISENDGRRNAYAAIEIWGRTIRAEIHNNTVFVSAAPSGAGPAVRVGNATIPDRLVSSTHFRNNIFVTSGGASLLDVSAAQSLAPDLRFEGNDYYASGSAMAIRWGTITYGSLAAWRVTGQETVGGAGTGFSVDPQLASPGAGGTLDDAARLESVDAYRLIDGSMMVDAGIDLAVRFGMNPGTRDYYGTSLPQRGGFDIGAGELQALAVVATDVVMRASSATTVAGAWRRVADTSAAGGVRLWHPDAAAPKLAAALAAPTNYFDLAFDAVAGRPYRLWLRLAAQNNSWANDSVFVQFSGAVTSTGAPAWRIGSTAAAEVNLEDCGGCGESGWGWQDNGYGAGVLGPLVYFASDGPQTLRVQTREDGVSVDQIVLSPSTFLSNAPGALKNDTTILSGTGPTSLEIVRYASDVPSTSIHGDWAAVADVTAAAGLALHNPNRGAAKITTALAAPSSYVDVPFTADAGTDYQVWLRLRADGNSTANDSVFLQFSGAVDASGSPQFRIGTTDAEVVVLQDYTGAPISGWGWNDAGWASLGPTVRFATTGAQTLRIQQREDGVSFDQIVISARKFLAVAPGSLTNDTTTVPR